VVDGFGIDLGKLVDNGDGNLCRPPFVLDEGELVRADVMVSKVDSKADLFAGCSF
jgi:hypothetical protein